MNIYYIKTFHFINISFLILSYILFINEIVYVVYTFTCIRNFIKYVYKCILYFIYIKNILYFLYMFKKKKLTNHVAIKAIVISWSYLFRSYFKSPHKSGLHYFIFLYIFFTNYLFPRVKPFSLFFLLFFFSFLLSLLPSLS